jgi:hypothetical protein
VRGDQRTEERHQEEDPHRRASESQALRHAHPRALGTIPP